MSRKNIKDARLKRLATKIFIAVYSSVIGLIFINQTVLARTYPTPTGYVNDFANIISDSVEIELENKLQAFEASSSHEIALTTLSSLEGDVIENTAVELFQQWGIGKKNQDNGVLLLIAPTERKLKIEVGYGLESILTDRRAGTIIRDIITPEFKKDNYEVGIVSGLDAIITILSSDPAAFDQTTPSSNQSSESKLDSFMFLFALLIYLSAFLARSKRFWPGGVIGAILGIIFVSITAGIMLGFWGLFLDFILSKNYKTRKKKGLSTSWWSSRGGFSSRSGSSSSSFGGFSGGSSGGGGASGGW